nr:NAC domain-containing protein [Tanacetum cinerariifolium]
MSYEPLGDDSKPRSYDVTFSNHLFNFNDDFTLCNDNPLFDEEFRDISSLDLPESTPVIDEGNDEGNVDLFFRTSSYTITPSCCILTERETANRHVRRLDEMQSKIDSLIMNLSTSIPEPLVNSIVDKESDADIKVTSAYIQSLPFLATMKPTNTLLMGDKIISTIPARETGEFIKSSVDDLVPIPRESEVTSIYDDLECDMPITTPVPTTVVTKENFDINSPLEEYVVDFLMENKV